MCIFNAIKFQILWFIFTCIYVKCDFKTNCFVHYLNIKGSSLFVNQIWLFKKIMKCIAFYMRRKNEEVQSVCSKSPKTSDLIFQASDKHMVYIVRHREKRSACILKNLLSNISNKKNNNLLIRSFISKKIKRFFQMSTRFFPVSSV